MEKIELISFIVGIIVGLVSSILFYRLGQKEIPSNMKDILEDIESPYSKTYRLGLSNNMLVKERACTRDMLLRLTAESAKQLNNSPSSVRDRTTEAGVYYSKVSVIITIQKVGDIPD